MRKFTFFISALLITAIAWAQQPTSQLHLLPHRNFSALKSLHFPTPGTENNLMPDIWQNSNSAGLRDEESIIGHTVFDYQTNGSISTRLIRSDDGTLSASWITLCEGGASSTRGTGYNYWNGTTWDTVDCHRVEPTDRTGYSCMGITSSGKELIVGHSSTAGGMIITSRPTKGTGPWTEDVTSLGSNPDDTWARIAVGGTDNKTVHAVWQSTSFTPTPVEYCGQFGAVVYSRSTDEGATWPLLHQCISLIDTPYYLGFGAEDYAIAAQGNNVAILESNSTTDLILLKSTDNGDTWTKTILWQFPIPLYDPTTTPLDTNEDGTPDVIAAPGSDGRVAFDNNGMIHVAFSETFVTSDGSGTGLSYYPQVDGGLWYWNEGMGSNPPVLIAAAQDFNGDSVIDIPADDPNGAHFGAGTYGQGLTMQPTLGFDAGNRIYITYATYDELADTTAYLCGHRHTYVIASFDGGTTWTTPYDVVPSIAEGGDGEDEEAVYGCMASKVGDYVEVAYQRDPAPGTLQVGTSDEITWNVYVDDIVYVKVQLGELTGTQPIPSNFFTVSQNSPNPFNDQTQFNITLNKSSDVILKVTNLLGQEVYNQKVNYAAGTHVFDLKKGNLSNGTYTFTAIAGGQQVTKKITIE